MKTTFEILNDGAFVVTKIDNELLVGFYHDVYNGDTTERIFEPIRPLENCTIEMLLNYCKEAN